MTTLLDKLKSDLSVITDDFKTFAKTYNDGLISTKSVSDAGGWVKYVESIKVTDKELLKFLGDVDNGNRKIGEIDDYMTSATAGANKFKTALKSIGANIGIMLAITIAVKAISTAFDYLNVTLEEQQEIVDNLRNEVEGLQIEYDELSGKGNLTTQEKNRLEMLERQLVIQEGIIIGWYLFA